MFPVYSVSNPPSLRSDLVSQLLLFMLQVACEGNLSQLRFKMVTSHRVQKQNYLLSGPNNVLQSADRNEFFSFLFKIKIEIHIKIFDKKLRFNKTSVDF